MTNKMSEQEAYQARVSALVVSMPDFFTSFQKLVQAGEDGNGFDGVRAIIASSRKARKLADDLLQYADTVEEMFNL